MQPANTSNSLDNWRGTHRLLASCLVVGALLLLQGARAQGARVSTVPEVLDPQVRLHGRLARAVERGRSHRVILVDLPAPAGQCRPCQN